MDRYAEYLVKKSTTSQDQMKKGLIIASAVLLCALTIFLVRIIGPMILIVTIGVLYAAYYLFTNLNVEYEYIVTNGELDVDKIIAKRKRTRLISVNAEKFTAFGRFDQAEPEGSDVTTVLCVGANPELGAYYADLETEDYGRTRIVFTPNQAVLDCIREALPRTLKYR